MIGFCFFQGVINSEGGIIFEFFLNEVQVWVEELEVQGDYNFGIVCFLCGVVKVCCSGVCCCYLISYQEDGLLLQELFLCDGIGMQIVMESVEQICCVIINDIGGILEFICLLEQQGILVCCFCE